MLPARRQVALLPLSANLVVAPCLQARSCGASRQLRDGPPRPARGPQGPSVAPFIHLPVYPTSSGSRGRRETTAFRDYCTLSLCVFSIHSSTCTFILHSFAPSEIHLTSISLCPLKGKPLRTLQRHQYLPHSFYGCADIVGEQNVPPGRVDYFELKSLEKQLVQKGPLTLPSVSLIAGNKSPM